MKHAAIPTVYDGIQMRSRLEARWAAFFDAIDLQWQYEPIELNGWIPDFIVEDIPGIEFANPAEKKTKPFLVEIKPIQVSRCFEHAPIEVRQKIEDALGSPRAIGDTYADRKVYHDKHHPGGANWEAFFDALPYHPLLLGNDPLSGWLFQNGAGWRPVAGYYLGDKCKIQHGCSCEPNKLPPCASEFSFVSNWREIWKKAGNKTQWRSPRP